MGGTVIGTRNVSFITFHGAHKGRGAAEKVVIGKSQGQRRRRFVQEGCTPGYVSLLQYSSWISYQILVIDPVITLM